MYGNPTMLNIFIGFVTFYLSFLFIIFIFNYVLAIFAPQWHLSYSKTLQIVNVAFAVSVLLFILSTIFVIPLQQSDEFKQGILISVFCLSYFSTAGFAFYDHHKNALKQKDKAIEQDDNDSMDA